MKRLIAVATTFCLLAMAPALLGAEKRAKTDDGKEVILHDDGTWEYVKEAPKDDKAEAKEFTKDGKSALAYKGKRGNFALYLVPEVWRKVPKPASAAAEVEFVHKDGDAMAMVIAERIFVPLEALRDVAIQNAKTFDENARVVKEEKRKVNGKDVLCVVIDAKPKGIGLMFYNYYYTGKEGSFQFITWTGQNLFEDLKPEMEAFLNGFEILPK